MTFPREELQLRKNFFFFWCFQDMISFRMNLLGRLDFFFQCSQDSFRDKLFRDEALEPWLELLKLFFRSFHELSKDELSAERGNSKLDFFNVLFQDELWRDVFLESLWDEVFFLRTWLLKMQWDPFIHFGTLAWWALASLFIFQLEPMKQFFEWSNVFGFLYWRWDSFENWTFFGSDETLLSRMENHWFLLRRRSDLGDVMSRCEVMMFSWVKEQKIRSIGGLKTKVLMIIEDVPECTRETLCTDL